jgi:hypothetical protein
MMQCCDEGTLRAYLEADGSLPPADRKAVEAHMAGCEDCRAELDNLRATGEQANARLSALAPDSAPNPQHALEKMRRALAEERAAGALSTTVITTQAAPTPPLEKEHAGDPNRRSIMQTYSLKRSGPRRAIFSGAAAALLLLSMLAFPSMRAAADQFLQSFRANSVMFLPVDANRLQQLEQANFDPSTLFLSKPEIVGTPKSDKVGSTGEAASIVGFQPGQPSDFPAALTLTDITVHEQMNMQAQVNVKTIRDLLQSMNINDVTLPDALGSAPIKAEIPPFVQTSYAGSGYHMTLVQGHTPTVTLPEGVELAQLGEAGLRVLGMQPDQAKELSRQIDWSTTLVVPFPEGMNDVLRVRIGDAQGLLVTSEAMPDKINAGGTHAVVYWQKGDRFYALEGSGASMNPDALLVAANSVK